MRILDIIEKKRDGHELSYEELEYVINSYVDGTTPDYQISALLMAIYLNGMTDLETTNLAIVMRDSGDCLDLSSISGIKVDKHSTGGVGDKTSLIIGPIVAACGLKFAKMSGRGLGHTGGTIDKLESIKGYMVEIGVDDFIKQVNEIGIALVSQTGTLAPADKKIYALRDVTSTVGSIPLIASSIMSKKLASGADVICLDVKVGSGAFMKKIEDAKKLASLMVEIGKMCNKNVSAILTNMDEPLGYAIGNSLEVIEAINTLNGNGPKDLEEICFKISAELLLNGGIVSSIDDGIILAKKSINDKSALNKLAELVLYQHGDESYIFDTSKFKKAKYSIEIKSKLEGYIKRVDALKIGHAAMLLGAGRSNLDDIIDHSVGIVLNKKINDYVKKDDILATIYFNKLNIDDVIEMIYDSYEYSSQKIDYNLIIDIVN